MNVYVNQRRQQPHSGAAHRTSLYARGYLFFAVGPISISSPYTYTVMLEDVRCIDDYDYSVRKECSSSP